MLEFFPIEIGWNFLKNPNAEKYKMRNPLVFFNI